MEFVEISENVLKSLITPIKGRLHIRNTLKNHRNLRNHLLKSLPAAGRCVIERACSSFSELSCSHFLSWQYLCHSLRYFDDRGT
jgi:hypothetical protein